MISVLLNFFILLLSIFLFLEQVADLGQQFFLSCRFGGSGGCLFLFLLELHQKPERDEDAECDDEEVDDVLDKHAVVERKCLAHHIPVRIKLRAAGSALRLVKVTLPVQSDTAGMMMSLTSDVTILPNAPPMMTPTAMSTTLPFMAKSLKSDKNFPILYS